MQKLAKQIANLSFKLSSDLKTLKTKAHLLRTRSNTFFNNSVRLKIKCVYLRSHSSQETSHQDASSQLSTVIADSNEYTYTVATSNRYETLVEENRSIVECILPNMQPNPSSTNHSQPSPTINFLLHPPKIRIMCTTQMSDYQRDRCCC